MPRRVSIAQRIVEDIRIAIERLWIPRPWHNPIGTEEASQLGIVPSGVVVAQPLATGQTALVILTGEALRC
jgi:hypothetical protein